MSSDPSIFYARVKTVWVLGNGPGAIAVPATVVATAKPCPKRAGHGNGRLVTFVDCGQVDNGVLRHANRTIAPMVNQILDLLGLPRHCFELSVINMAVASLQDLRVQVSGFSIDTALFVAMLAAALRVVVRRDVMLTGHISSRIGAIGMVRCLAAKMQAAQLDPEVVHLIYPRVDAATAQAFPDAAETVRPSSTPLERRIQTTAVDDISQLLPLVFSEIALVLTSLRHGYYQRHPQDVADGSPVVRAALYLSQDLESRFWAMVEYGLQTADNDLVALSLTAVADYWLRENRYPNGTGHRLRQALLALPPWTRKRDIRYPLLPLNICFRLAGLAAESDHEDALQFVNVTHGRQLAGIDDEPATPHKSTFDANAAVRRALSSISAEAMAASIARPLDEARATLVLDRVKVNTHDEFFSIVEFIYRHLILHSQLVKLPEDDALVADEAHRLLRDAFSEEGGVQGAESEARNASHGGLRYIADHMVNRKIEELKFHHVERILREITDPYNRKQKNQFMRALIEHLGPQLPADIRKRPASDFVEKTDFLVRSLVRNRDHMISAFRSI